MTILLLMLQEMFKHLLNLWFINNIRYWLSFSSPIFSYSPNIYLCHFHNKPLPFWCWYQIPYLILHFIIIKLFPVNLTIVCLYFLWTRFQQENVSMEHGCSGRQTDEQTDGRTDRQSRVTYFLNNDNVQSFV